MRASRWALRAYVPRPRAPSTTYCKASAARITGFPGNRIIGPENATIGRILLDNGYRTAWFGKDHNTPDWQMSQTGPFGQWPMGTGFEYFYGFVGGDTSQWQPNLFRNTTQIYPFLSNPGWNLITAMADDAIHWMRQLNDINQSMPRAVDQSRGESKSRSWHGWRCWTEERKVEFGDASPGGSAQLGQRPSGTMIAPPTAAPPWWARPSKPASGSRLRMDSKLKAGVVKILMGLLLRLPMWPEVGAISSASLRCLLSRWSARRHCNCPHHRDPRCTPRYLLASAHPHRATVDTEFSGVRHRGPLRILLLDDLAAIGG